MNRILKLLLLVGIIALPLMVGCGGGSGSSNPIGSSVVSDSTLSSNINANFVECRYSKPETPKFSNTRSNHSVVYHIMDGVERIKARLRVILSGIGADEVYVKISSMSVTNSSGQKITIDVPDTKINIADGSAVSELIGSLELPEGIYKGFTFNVDAAKIMVDGKEKDLYFAPVLLNLIFKRQKQVAFSGVFELKDGYFTNLNIAFMHKVIKVKPFITTYYVLIPTVKITSELVAAPVESTITTGSVSGSVADMVTSSMLPGVTVALEGTSYSAVTSASGSFSFADVPAGSYRLVTSNDDYLAASYDVTVEAGNNAEVVSQIHPKIVRSNVVNTGWFSEYYPFADANGEYAEASMETPVQINFVSMAFTKAELVFTAEMQDADGTAICYSYLSATQQVSADADMTSWWCGSGSRLGEYLGEFAAKPSPGTTYTVDVTEIIRNNPSSAYYFASKNTYISNIKMSNVQLSVFYE